MTTFFNDFETLGQYHDLWSSILLNAPDGFCDFDGNPVDQGAALEEAYDALRSGFVFVERKLKAPRQLKILREMIDMSREAYLAGDAKTGAHTLQECEGLIWTSRKLRLKYVVEAERRAFGTVELYADVKVSSYPFEGTKSDLTPDEVKLYAEATQRSLDFFAKREDFKPFVLLLDTAGAVRQMKQQSWKKTKEELVSLVAKGESLGFVRSEVAVSGMRGVLVHDIETTGRRQVSVRSLVQDYVCDAARFHLDEASVLGADA